MKTISLILLILFNAICLKVGAQTNPDSSLIKPIEADSIINTYNKKSNGLNQAVKSYMDSLYNDLTWFRSGRKYWHPFFKDYSYRNVDQVFESKNIYYILFEHGGSGYHSHLVMIDKMTNKRIVDLLYVGKLESFESVKNTVASMWISEE
jgi:hypothetical protein